MNYKTWWDNEGSGMPPLPNEDMEEFSHRMTQIVWAKAAAAEREACAKLCDYVYDNIVTDEHIKDMAFKIRARGETK